MVDLYLLNILFISLSEILDELFNRITFVVGPTASGKSAWALAAAKKLGGAIVNADSVQIYRGLDIGAAKPSPQERQEVPHYLYDIAEPSQAFTAGDYRRAALQLIEEKLPQQPLYFVGGSGFYIQALEKGMFEVGGISVEIKLQVDVWQKSGELYTQLLKRDPESAKNISSQDEYRQRRALEVTLSEGRPLSQIQKEFQLTQKTLGEQYPLSKVGLFVERDVLRQRIERRTQIMLAQGLIAEVQGLLAQGFAGGKALSSIGYKEVVDLLRGELDENELIPTIVTNTMQLAKRQMTWFRRDKEIVWYKSHGVDNITISSS